MNESAAPERIEVIGGARVVITWDDLTQTTLSAFELRSLCPCAGCREEPGRRQIASLLADQEAVTITDTRLVGAYAVNFIFGPDGHGTGIYPFSSLYELGESGN